MEFLSMETVDEMLTNGEFIRVDDYINNISIEMIKLLTITLSAKSKLPSRNYLVEEVETILRGLK